MKKNLILLVAAAGLLLGACGGEESGSVALGTPSTSTTTSTTASTATSTTASTPPSSTPAGPSTTAVTRPTPRPTEPTEDLTGFQTEPFRRERILAVPPVPVVTGIRTAHHEGFDRVVFDLDPSLPAAESARYVDRLVQDGSGMAVTVAGNAFLQVRFEDGQAHNDTGAPTVPRRIQPGLAAIREIALVSDYEGYVTIGLGLADRAPFRVLSLTNPARIVVDVRAA